VAILAPGHLPVVQAIAQRYPGLTLIVDHLAVPRGAVGPRALQHWPELLALADLPNVHVKAVGVGDYALDPYPFASLEKPLQQVFEAYGEDRVMWGSDLSRLHHPYAQCVQHFQEHLPFLTPTAREKVMGGNILKLLRWN
jgi:L-fuconolactonase